MALGTLDFARELPALSGQISRFDVVTKFQNVIVSGNQVPFEESGATERSAASRIGVNRRTLHRWSELLDSLPLSLRLHTPA